MFSFYYQSRLNVHLRAGGGFDCEDMRAGCPGLAADGEPPNYSYVLLETSPDTGHVPPNAPQGTSIYPKTAGLPSSAG